MGLFGFGKAACAKCGNRVDKKKEAFECTACGRVVCRACVADAYVATHGYPSMSGDPQTAVMLVIMSAGDQGKAPCPVCNRIAAKRCQ